MDDYFDHYKLIEEYIVHIEISFKQKLLSEFSLNRPLHVFKDEIINTDKLLNILVSVNEESLGESLRVKTHNGFITWIFIRILDKLYRYY